MTEPIFYIVEIDLPAEDRAAAYKAFAAWYAGVHAPHLYEAGFTCCTSYRALQGRMEIVDVYQADDWSIFESARFARYRAVAAGDPHLPPFMPAIANLRTPYRYMPWRGQSHDVLCRPLAADWIAVWRFRTDGDLLARAADWLADGGEAMLLAAGVHGIRLLARTRPAPTGHSTHQDGAIVLEWHSPPAGNLLDGSWLPDWLATALGGDVAFAGSRLYPWAEHPAAHALADYLPAST
jgi:hypothetical protein